MLALPGGQLVSWPQRPRVPKFKPFQGSRGAWVLVAYGEHASLRVRGSYEGWKVGAGLGFLWEMEESLTSRRVPRLLAGAGGSLQEIG